MPKKCNSSSALCRRPQSPATACCSFSEWNCSSTLSRNGASMHPRIRESVHSSTSRDSSGRPPMQRVRRARSLERSSAAAKSPIRNRLTSEHATVCLNTFGDGYLFKWMARLSRCVPNLPRKALWICGKWSLCTLFRLSFRTPLVAPSSSGRASSVPSSRDGTPQDTP